jgi:cytochrome c553
MNSSKHILALSLVALLAACGGKEEPKAPAMTTQAPPAAASEAAAPAQAMAEAPSAEGVGVEASTLYTSRCASCHGMLAEGQSGNPSLVNLSAADIKAKLEGYRAGQKMGPKTVIMASAAKNLTDAEITALATFLGN